MPTQFARQSAIPCRLADVSTGAWVQNDGLVPSGVRTPRGLISRASIIGVMIDKQEAFFSLDDGTGVVTVRSFDATPPVVHAKVGDVVLVIGRPREYNGERYLVLEICKRLRNHAWIDYRRQELELLGTQEETTVTPEPQAVAPDKGPVDRVLERIRELDAGSGADVEEVLTAIPDGEPIVKTLLEDGEIFEIRPGRVKVLE